MSTAALQKLRSLGWADRGLLLETLLWLGLARLALLTVPFKWIAPLLGRQMAETGPDLGSCPEEAVLRVGWAVRGVARRTPWESACLAQAIAAGRMLQRRGIPNTLYLGMAKGETGEWQAHAWLRCGPHILTGGPGHERFAVVSTFASTRRPRGAESWRRSRRSVGGCKRGSPPGSRTIPTQNTH